jgi:hypothetical protein
LIKRAEADWDDKMKRQSETLAGAAAEYRRRYHRAPPKGFDEWCVLVYLCISVQALNVGLRWSYCQRHNVQLIDEYDRIYNDLEPFWGMDPVDLNKIQAQLETERDSYTIGKTRDSTITMVASALPEPGPNSPTRHFVARANDIADMLSEVADFIPPFRATFSPHDNPDMVTDWELKAQALHAAATGTCTYNHLSDCGLPYLCILQISTSTTRRLQKILDGHPRALQNRLSAVPASTLTILLLILPKKHLYTTT